MNNLLRKPVKKTVLSLVALLAYSASYAEPDKAQLLVWANEAIISTYSMNYKTYLQDQKNNAKYFTSSGWIAYSKALNASKLPEAIQKNAYDVSAVAIEPPQLTAVDATHWTVVMPILVQYQNPQYKQQQTLKVTLGITTASEGQGVRGLSITSLQSATIQPPCQCPMPTESKKDEKQ